MDAEGIIKSMPSTWQFLTVVAVVAVTSAAGVVKIWIDTRHKYKEMIDMRNHVATMLADIATLKKQVEMADNYSRETIGRVEKLMAEDRQRVIASLKNTRILDKIVVNMLGNNGGGGGTTPRRTRPKK